MALAGAVAAAAVVVVVLWMIRSMLLAHQVASARAGLQGVLVVVM